MSFFWWHSWGLPQMARQATGGMIFHVLNRGNARKPIFDDGADQAAFEKVLAEAQSRPGSPEVLSTIYLELKAKRSLTCFTCFGQLSLLLWRLPKFRWIRTSNLRKAPQVRIQNKLQ